MKEKEFPIHFKILRIISVINALSFIILLFVITWYGGMSERSSGYINFISYPETFLLKVLDTIIMTNILIIIILDLFYHGVIAFDPDPNLKLVLHTPLMKRIINYSIIRKLMIYFLFSIIAFLLIIYPIVIILIIWVQKVFSLRICYTLTLGDLFGISLIILFVVGTILILYIWILKSIDKKKKEI